MGPDISAVEQIALDEGGRPKKKKKRDQGHNVRDLITALAICNNVTPVPDDPDLKNVLEVAKDIKGRGTIQQPPNLSALISLSPAGLRKPNLRHTNSEKRNFGTKMIL
jgi:hypothetical protein